MTNDELWELIHAEYRLGEISIYELARKYGVHTSSIRYRARTWGWDRDVAKDIERQTQFALTASHKGREIANNAIVEGSNRIMEELNKSLEGVKVIDNPEPQTCGLCKGEGVLEINSKKILCTECEGSGVVNILPPMRIEDNNTDNISNVVAEIRSRVIRRHSQRAEELHVAWVHLYRMVMLCLSPPNPKDDAAMTARALAIQVVAGKDGLPGAVKMLADIASTIQKLERESYGIKDEAKRIELKGEVKHEHTLMAKISDLSPEEILAIEEVARKTVDG